MNSKRFSLDGARRVAVVLILTGSGCAIGFSQPKYSLKQISDVSKGRWTAITKYPVFEAPHSLRALANRTIETWVKKDQAQFGRQARQYFQNPGPGPRFDWTYDVRFTVSDAGHDLISCMATIFTYTGGAHPNTTFQFFNFGMVKGRPKVLTIQDLFYRHVRALDEVSNVVIAKLLNNMNAEWVQNGEVKHLTKQQGDQFVIGKSGLTYHFEPYAMGPYVAGSFEVPVPFSELSGLLDPSGPLKGLLSR
jgi:hypothetical protein